MPSDVCTKSCRERATLRHPASRPAWSLVICVGLLPVMAARSARGSDAGPYQATGLKVGEVSARAATVWTRLTLRPRRNPSDGPRVRIEYEPAPAEVGRRERDVAAVVFPDGVTVRDLREAVPGTDGDVRVRYRPASGEQKWRETPWRAVRPLRDFTRQFPLRDLVPHTRYELRVESRGVDGQPGTCLTGSFRTAPEKSDPQRIVFTVSTGQGNDDQDIPEGFKIYPSMRKLDPDFFVHTGDIVYYDDLAKTPALARYHWQRTYSWPTNVEFHRHVASYFIKDDHDTWKDDCWPTMESPYMHAFTFRQGQQIFREQVPMGRRTYRTRRWGRDLQVWMVEGRDFRSANDAPDGPDKTIWGKEQKQWFKRSLQRSDATFRILISPTPMVGPDRDSKRDNHANAAFRHEGDELRKFLASQPGVVVVCGDRHWQYMSVDPETGLHEYSCGPASDVHAGGWRQEDFRPDIHRYLNVIGGFLSVTVERAASGPTAAFRFHDVDGNVKYEDVMDAP